MIKAVIAWLNNGNINNGIPMALINLYRKRNKWQWRRLKIGVAKWRRRNEISSNQ